MGVTASAPTEAQIAATKAYEQICDPEKCKKIAEATYHRLFAAIILLLAIVVMVLVWFTGITFQIVSFVMGFLILAFAILIIAVPIVCRPCKCT